MGPRSFRVFEGNYRDKYLQVLFVAVGVIDCAIPATGVGQLREYEGTEEAQLLKRKTQLTLDPYLAAAHELRMKAACRVSISKTPIEALDSLATKIMRDYPRSVFFLSKLVFQKLRWFQHFLYGGTADKIRKRLQEKRFPVTIIPVVA